MPLICTIFYKPIKGHAGGKITAGEMIEDSRCFQVGDSVSAFIRLAGILSNVDNCYRSWVCQNNGVRPLFITEAGECYFEPDHTYQEAFSSAKQPGFI